MIEAIRSWIGKFQPEKISCLLALAIFAGHFLLAVSVAFPWAYRDEACYLINAAALAGYKTDCANSYAIGYSVFLVPIFELLKDPDHVFLAATSLNAIFASLLFLSIYSFLKTFFRGYKWALATSTVISLYAPIWVYANQAMPEILLGLFYMWTIQLFAFGMKKPRGNHFIIFAALAALMPLIHYRTIPVTFAAFTVLVAGYRRRAIGMNQLIYCTIAAGLTIILGLLLKLLVDAHLSFPDSAGDKHYVSVAHTILETLKSFKSISLLLGSFAGQLLYVGGASCGFTLIGVILMLRDARREAQDPGRSMTYYYVLVSFIGCFLISCLFKLGATYQDQLIFGRFNDMISVPIMAIGMMLFLNGSGITRKRAVFIGILFMIAAGFIFLITRGDQLQALQGSRIRYFNISGISILLNALGGVNIIGLTVYCVSILLVILVSWGKSPRYFFSLVGVLLSFNAAVGVFESNQDGLRRRNAPGMNMDGSSNIVELIRRNAELLVSAMDTNTNARCIKYDLSSQNAWFKWHYNWQLYDWAILKSAISGNHSLYSPLIISSNRNVVPGARILTREKDVDQYLILAPGQANERLLAYHIGDLIDFSRKGNSFRYQSSGWSAPGAAGVSMEGDEACLTLRPVPNDRPLRLMASIRFSKASHRAMDILVDGIHLTSWKSGASERFDAHIPNSFLGKEAISICFRVADQLASGGGEQGPILIDMRLIHDGS